MPTKRQRASGSWEFTIRRSKLLPKPLSLTFDTEAEGDTYCARVEQLLDAGILPEDIVAQRQLMTTVGDAIRAYLQAVSVPVSDKNLLNTLLGTQAAVRLVDVDYAWAETWVRLMKRRDHMSPSTIRHYAGALARCFDWARKTETSLLTDNPLRHLPRRYATYTEEDARAMQAQKLEAKHDHYRDRRPAEHEQAAIRKIMAGAKPEGRERPLELPYRPAIVFLFELAIESAMRMREMYTLEVAQFDVPRRTVALERTKNGHKRQVPLTSVALLAYERYVSAVESGDPDMHGFTFASGAMFPWVSDMAAAMRAENQPALRAKLMERVTSRLSGQYGRIFDAAGCGDLVFHDLRHEATSRLYERTTLTDVQIAKITGHRDPKVLMRYANLRGSDLAERLW